VQHATVEGATLAYETSGSGEPVALIHGALIADTFRPLLAEPSLTRFRLINYHRRGYAHSSQNNSGPVGLTTQAADCWALLRHLGVERAHIVGHSYGGAVALQLALDAPDVVHSLTLLEPALMLGASAEFYRQSLAVSVQRYREVGASVVVHEFLQARWPGYRGALDSVLPGAFAQAVRDAGPAFDVDLQGLFDWRFGEQEARRVTQPTLAVLGGDSNTLSPRFDEVQALLLRWLPCPEGLAVPGVTHFMQVEEPRRVAEALADFYERYPLPT